MSNFALMGFKYGPDPRPGTSGGVLTWSIKASVPAGFVPVIAAAFDLWSAHADIRFERVGAGRATIAFDVAPIDGLNGVLGYGGSSFHLDGGALKQAVNGFVTFDSGENWRPNARSVISGGNVDLFSVAVHEIGHVLGLGHHDRDAAIMNTYLDPTLKHLTASDIEGIRHLYGAPVPAPVATPSRPDVAAGTGRLDPGVAFAAEGYLAANPDLVAARVDPATHYALFGWREGRDPSAGFDTALYLARNPDIRAAGVDPLAHFQHFGEAEGRAAHAAVGSVADLAAGQGFDARYYLLANPDIARAALQAGGDTLAFAENHHDRFGWREGRDPNALFDTGGYLDAYADVRAAGIDPLAHYHAFGWREGRDPSADFDTRAYLGANGDVAAAGIDPLLHYLQSGALEGRSPFADGSFG